MHKISKRSVICELFPLSDTAWHFICFGTVSALVYVTWKTFTVVENVFFLCVSGRDEHHFMSAFSFEDINENV